MANSLKHRSPRFRTPAQCNRTDYGHPLRPPTQPAREFTASKKRSFPTAWRTSEIDPERPVASVGIGTGKLELR